MQQYKKPDSIVPVFALLTGKIEVTRFLPNYNQLELKNDKNN